MGESGFPAGFLQAMDALTEYFVIFYAAGTLKVEWANNVLCGALKLPLERVQGRTCAELGLSALFSCKDCPVKTAAESGAGTVAGRHPSSIQAFLMPPLYDSREHVLEMVRNTLSKNEMEERYRQLADTSPDMIFITDEDGKVKYANPAAASAFGMTAAQMTGKRQEDLFPQDLAQKQIKRLREVFATGKPYEGDNVIRFPGRVMVQDVRLLPLKDERGRITSIMGIARDVTERKEAMEQLTHANERIIDILSSISDAFFAIDDNMNVYYYNKEAERLIGQGRVLETVIGRNIMDVFPEARNTDFFQKYRQVVLEKKPLHFEAAFGTGNRMNSYDVRFYPQRKGVSIYFQTTTERKKTEEALHYRYRLQETLFLIAASFIKAKVSDIDLYIRETLRSLGEFAGASRCSLFILSSDNTIISNTHEWCALPSDSEAASFINVPTSVFGYYWKILKKREYVLMRKLDDLPSMAVAERHWVATHGFRPLILVPLVLQGFLYGMLGLYGKPGEERDWPEDLVTMLNFSGSILINALERKNAEEALAAEKERLLVTLGSIGDGVITTDISGKVILMNRVAEELTGWGIEEAVGRPLFQVLSLIEVETHKPYDNPMNEMMRREGIPGITRRNILLSRDGRERMITDIFSPIHDRENRSIGSVIVFSDITEKLKLEESLQSSEKLESIGVLAGGIAHDFNNLLGGIYGYVELAQGQTAKGSKPYDYLDKALCVFKRAKNLTQQLLTFSKGGKPVKKVQNLKPLLEEYVHFVLSGSNVTAAFILPPGLWPCDIDENQVGQVIDNIVINSRQAMPEGGTVTIRAQNREAGSHLPYILGQGQFVMITITDLGQGIPKEHLSRVFDPFFTTKHQGSGLGLATAYAIMRKHDGHIEVESEVGKGTTFTLYLPASPQAAVAGKSRTVLEHKGQGRILVMDDEDFIRDVARKILQKLGYVVDCAPHGEEALAMYEKAMLNKIPYDLVILDLTIPGGMGGQEVITKLKQMDPAIKAIASSGYSEDPVMAAPQEFGFKGRLVKPYLITEIIEILSAVLPVRGSGL